MSNTFAALRLLPMGDSDERCPCLAASDAVLECQLGEETVRFTRSDRVFLAALLHRLPTQVLGRMRLLVRPDTVSALAP